MSEKVKAPATRFYRKKTDLFTLLDKMKLWPSRTGRLHGIRTITRNGDVSTIVTHCNREFTIHNSRKSRAARWLRSKMYQEACPLCKIPDWKLAKYGATFFSRRQGSFLKRK